MGNKDILKELEAKLPSDAKIAEVKFEASEIVLYTKSREFFINGEPAVREIVHSLKKRVEVRPELSITEDPAKTKEIIERLVPAEADIKNIYFEPELGKVVIEAGKPGLVIGRGGETFKRIREETCWLPKIERAPAISSDIVRAVRALLHSEIDYRKKFLNKIGQRINEDVKIEPDKFWVRATFLGAGRQVGRSCILVQTPNSNILLDCGLSPGASEDYPYLSAPEFDIEKLDAVVISHSHVDHMGFLPFLYETGYTGPTYCTPPTRDTMVLLALDCVDLMQKDGRKVLYQKKAVEKMVKHSIALEYGEVHDITPDIRLTLQPAGHLLGSAQAHLHIGDGLHNLLYTGDFKFAPTRLFDPAFTDFRRAETVIMESTYGAPTANFPPREEIERNFMNMVARCMERGGKALIPSFAVGRAQEMMSVLAENNFSFPVWMEGMVWDATAIHTAYPEYMSQNMQRNVFRYGKNPLTNPMFHHVVPKERDSILDSAQPGVVIATSGMLTGGPAMEYLKALAPDKKNMLIFVGYQGEGTLGRRIQKGWKEIPLRSEEGRARTLRIELEIETAHGFTGHSSYEQLMSFVRRLGRSPTRIITNHGEPQRCVGMARELHKIHRIETYAPRNLESIRLV